MNPFKLDENEFNQLSNLLPKPQLVPANDIKGKLGQDEISLLRRIGLTQNSLSTAIEDSIRVNYDRMTLYGQLARCAEHWLAAAALELYADYSCLTASTKLPLLDGRTLTISEIVDEYKEGKEMWVYSCDYDGTPKPEKILHAIKQEKKPETLRVWLDNGEYVEASINHRFVKRDGSLCRADELVVGDSLLPFHRLDAGSWYEKWWNIPKSTWISTYAIVAEQDESIELHEYCFDGISKEQMNGVGLVPSYNHKVVKIESIGQQEVYDVSVSGSHLFGLDCGIYIHNTNFSSENSATVWVTSNSDKYVNELTDLFNRIGVEEKIYDWAHTLAMFGDHFLKPEIVPGMGVISVTDDSHPLDISRAEYKGQLLGFYRTPISGAAIDSRTSGDPSQTGKLIPPWDYVHLRLLGAKKYRGSLGDPQRGDIRSLQMVTGASTYQLTTRYGTSLLMAALPSYKRLRMAEDSMLMARVTRGIIRYIWKLKVSSCLRGDTKIQLMDGTTPTIREMAENENDYVGKTVWTINEKTQELEPKKILEAKRTRRNAEMVRVHLDNGEHVDATPDHKFMLRCGVFVESQYLGAGDKLRHSYTGMERSVVGIERLTEREDTYDLTIEDNHNFPLASGIFVHNSNSEAVAELIDQYATLITRARSVDTDADGDGTFSSRQSPWSVMEDLFVPVWGDTGDLTYEKIGGEADIRWIVDIEELRNQMAVALRTPLSLLGGFISEASGALGAEAIEKLDLRFARNARRLQRAIIGGVYRLCQIHLAAMNLDPDPSLFSVHMDSTSSIEEGVLRENLDQGVDTIDKFVASAAEAEPDLDKPKLWDYLAERILKISGFSLSNFVKSVQGITGESATSIKNELVDIIEYRRKTNILSRNTDLVAHLPMDEDKMWKNLETSQLNESLKADVRKDNYILSEKDKNSWEEKYGNVIIKEVREGEEDEEFDGDETE